MYKILRFWFFSKYKHTYIELAEKHNTTAWRVYSLAHGKEPKNSDEHAIVSSLKKRKIIRHIHSRKIFK